MLAESKPRLIGLRRSLTAALVVALAALASVARAQATCDRAPIRNPELTVRMYVWSYKELKERQVVMQKYDYSCGAAVLATIMRYYWGDNVAEANILELLPKLKLTEKELKDRVENGLTLTDLRNLANLAGYQATMAKVQFHELAQGKVPVVVGITVRKHEHFAVFRGADEVYAYLADPIRGNIRTPVCEFLEQWQKNAILVVAKPNTPVKKVNPLGIYPSEYYRGGTNRQYVRQDGLMPQIPLWAPIGP
ncbi:MAG: C39 family peptidase [Pirellulales bacterium]